MIILLIVSCSFVALANPFPVPGGESCDEIVFSYPFPQPVGE